MTEHPLVEIVEHHSSIDAAEVVAEEAAAWLGICTLSGQASIALPGGRSPARLLGALAAHPLDWRRITVTTTDERQVPLGHRLSNMGAVRRAFAGTCGQRATFVPLDGPDAAARIAFPFDLAIIGMGADGHIASLFPNASAECDHGGVLFDVTPDPIPIEAPVSRRTWSLSTLASARRTFLFISGPAKRAALERALDQPGVSPVGALMRQACGPVSVHWSVS